MMKIVNIHSLMDCIKRREMLWNTENPYHKSKLRKAKAWMEIANELEIPVERVKTKWKNLKDVFKKELNKNPITCLDEYEGSWRHFESLWNIFYGPNHKRSLNGERSDKEERSDKAGGSHDDKSYDDVRNDEKSYNSDDDRSDNSFTHTSIKREPESASSTAVYFTNDALSDRLDEFEEPAAKRQKEDYDVMFEEPAAKVQQEDYDMMFLKSLAPYFKALKPIRKLAVRNKIQKLLMEELGL